MVDEKNQSQAVSTNITMTDIYYTVTMTNIILLDYIYIYNVNRYIKFIMMYRFPMYRAHVIHSFLPQQIVYIGKFVQDPFYSRDWNLRTPSKTRDTVRNK